MIAGGSLDVVVVGAGVIGASTAYHLSRVGDRSVALVDRGTIGGGGTESSAAGRAITGTPLRVPTGYPSMSRPASSRRERSKSLDASTGSTPPSRPPRG